MTAKRRIRQYLRYAILTLLLWQPCALHAQITVTDVIYHFVPSEKPVHNVMVHNSSDEAMYVTVDVSQVTRAGFPDEKREPTKQIVASPQRFSVPPQGDRTVRLLLRKPLVEAEDVYRVGFVPSSSPFEDSDAQSKSQKRMGLRVLTGIGMLIFVDPKEVRPELAWERKSGQIKFTNRGNVNLFLTDAQVCSSLSADGQGTDCQPTKGVAGRLYPGNEKTVNVPENKTLVLSKRYGEQQQERVVIRGGA